MRDKLLELDVGPIGGASVNRGTLLEAGLAYAKRGWRVFPLQHRSKHPLPGSKGLLEATIDETAIRAWWSKMLQANIGIACGPSNLVVIDLDARKGGKETWHRLCQQNGLNHLATVTGLTGGGGVHLLFEAPVGVEIASGVGVLGDGVDVKAKGGYIVAPPSIHPNGTRYEWEVSSHPDDRSPAPLPEVLVRLLRSRMQQKAPELPARIEEGQRNALLASLAGSMRRRGASEEAIRAALAVENGKRCEPPLPEREVERIAKSIAGYAPTLPTGSGRIGRPVPSLAEFHNTDLGNARRLVAMHGDHLRYCTLWRKWLVWDGRRWAVDATAEVRRKAKETISAMYATAGGLTTEEARKELAQHAMRSEATYRIKAMLELAESEEGTAITPGQLDQDEWLLNLENGTLNLRTGKLRPHNRQDLMSKLAPVSYDPEAKCPTWMDFLNYVMGGNQGLIDFLQEAVGYSLTGDSSEQVMFILYGTGNNGKTTFLRTVGNLLGDYAAQTPTETLLVKRHSQIPNDVARLRGARFVSATEAEENRRLAESLIKQLTGGDKVAARFLYAEWFEYVPTYKIFLGTNHKPVIRGTDPAIWRRIRLIPFEVTIPERKRDRRFLDKLLPELSGILNWAVAGCLAWQSDGLKTPVQVREATAAYRTEMDHLMNFLEDRCVMGEGFRVQASDLYKAYCEWCGGNNERALTGTRFGRRMSERGFEKERSRFVFYLGVGLRDQEASAQEELEF